MESLPVSQEGNGSRPDKLTGIAGLVEGNGVPLDAGEIDLDARFEDLMSKAPPEIVLFLEDVLREGSDDPELLQKTISELIVEFDLDPSQAEIITQKFGELGFLPIEPEREHAFVQEKDNPFPATDSLQLFLVDVGKHKLLSAAEEVRHAQEMEAGLEAEERLLEAEERLKELKALQTTNNDSEEASLEELISDLEGTNERGKRAKRIMIESNLRLVVSIAKRYRGQGVPFLDLIQEGALGLSRAVEKFDWRKGYKFSTYATWWIRQAVQRAVANQARTIRVPVHVVERQQKMRRADRRLRAESGGREPTDDELAQATGLDVHFIEEANAAAHVDTSLNLPVGDDNGGELSDLFADPDAPDPFDEAEESIKRQNVRKVLDSLPERERRILELRFGFEGEPWTLEDIGHELDLTRERVRQLEGQALARLSEKARAGGLGDR